MKFLRLFFTAPRSQDNVFLRYMLPTSMTRENPRLAQDFLRVILQDFSKLSARILVNPLRSHGAEE